MGQADPVRRPLVLTGGPAVGKSSTAVAEAKRRVATRRVWLTDEEFDDLHMVDQRDPPLVDQDVNVTNFSLSQQAAALERIWMGYRF